MRPAAVLAAAALGLAACAPASPPAPMTVAETEAWIESVYGVALAAPAGPAVPGAIAARCKAAGLMPGTLEHARCRSEMEAHAAALAKAAALARIGRALGQAAPADDPLIGRTPERIKSLYCYDAAQHRLHACQDI